MSACRFQEMHDFYLPVYWPTRLLEHEPLLCPVYATSITILLETMSAFCILQGEEQFNQRHIANPGGKDSKPRSIGQIIFS